MSDYVDNHPLGRDFPQLREKIHELKTGDAHFRRLMHEYEDIDRSVVRAEQGVDHLSDLDLDGLKAKRVHLKDSLYAMLTA